MFGVNEVYRGSS